MATRREGEAQSDLFALRAETPHSPGRALYDGLPNLLTEASLDARIGVDGSRMEANSLNIAR